MIKEDRSIILRRKLVAASISGTIYAIILGFSIPNPFEDESFDSVLNYVYASIGMIPVYMMYSFPAIVTYGVLTSALSEKVGEFISIKSGNSNAELIISLALHMIFGLILLLFSLGAAVLYFVTDRILKRRNRNIKWYDALTSLSIPVLTWFVTMGTVWIMEL
ncbi:hypothetical protein ABE65_010900 [Fictibacillus phosphorivorans]|uniref:Uncharacterized protein n=1 Tax=Fictibacillus phosphorivorans TaxID=1221500 RepID=A0A160INW5_9BACL|nr:hypothetical protein [Fictibacillus phosphorivorans]ANC77282.1 hypothetical protein ABE65_010900 [Fictibacillus phosphorivorans]